MSNTEPPRTASEEWQWRRAEVLIRDHYECQADVCDAKGGPRGEARLTAHHIVPASEGGSNNKDNRETRCENCHKEAHPRGWNAHTDPSGVTIETDGKRLKDTGTGRYVEKHTGEDFIDAIRNADDQPSPPEIADTLGCANRTALIRLHELADAETVKQRKVGAVNLWSLTENGGE